MLFNFKSTILAIIFSIKIIVSIVYSQNQTSLYDPYANPFKQIDSALKIAKSEDKHIFIQIGGNWCPWCIKFHNFITNDKTIDSLIKANYVIIRINYSKENTNVEMMKKLEYPNRFGFPVFVILDSNGKRIHTQDSSLLEEDKSYNRNKVITFLKQWSPSVLKDEYYKGKF